MFKRNQKSASFIAYIKYMKQINIKSERYTKFLEYSSANVMPAAGTTPVGDRMPHMACWDPVSSMHVTTSYTKE